MILTNYYYFGSCCFMWRVFSSSLVKLTVNHFTIGDLGCKLRVLVFLYYFYIIINFLLHNSMVQSSSCEANSLFSKETSLPHWEKPATSFYHHSFQCYLPICARISQVVSFLLFSTPKFSVHFLSVPWVPYTSQIHYFLFYNLILPNEGYRL
jgi:hypothetical protein